MAYAAVEFYRRPDARVLLQPPARPIVELRDGDVRALFAGDTSELTETIADLIRVLTGALAGDERAQVVDTLARVVREADTRLTPRETEGGGDDMPALLAVARAARDHRDGAIGLGSDECPHCGSNSCWVAPPDRSPIRCAATDRAVFVIPGEADDWLYRAVGRLTPETFPDRLDREAQQIGGGA